MALEDEFEVFTAHSAEAAMTVLSEEAIQVILCDQRMPGTTGVELLARMRAEWPETVRIIVSGYTDTDDIIRSINEAGIYQFLVKPWHPDQLLMAARNAARLFRLQRDNVRMELEMRELGATVETRLAARRTRLREGFSFERIVRAPGSVLEPVCALGAQIASFDVPALIEGETGTGKELLARAIHYASLRSDKPFIAVNCGAIPDELLESELFGHKRGAFTGAHQTRVGLLEQAHGGTIFLDEIGDTSPAFQVKLLRFLQEGELRPVGSNETRRVNVRVVAATNRDLHAEAHEGRFREDLYFRLAVAPLRVPALRERPGDIPLLVERLLERAMKTHGKRVAAIEADVLTLLARHDWPGNVRELENEVVRLLMLADGDRLTTAHLSPHVLHAKGADADHAGEDGNGGALKERVERLEARILRETLTRHRWNKSRAADELGLSRVGLRAKLERYRIEPPLRAVGAEVTDSGERLPHRADPRPDAPPG